MNTLYPVIAEPYAARELVEGALQSTMMSLMSLIVVGAAGAVGTTAAIAEMMLEYEE